MPPQLSVIIPAHNEAAILPGLLSDLRRQDLSPADYEVIVVADRCRDATATIARAHGAQVIECDAGNGSVAKNTGAAAARSPLLLFIDADSRLPDSNFLTTFLALSKKQSNPFIATCRYQPQTGHPAARLIARVKNFLISYRLIRTANAGGCMAISRSLFQTVGGFWPDVYPFELINLVRRAHRSGGTFIFLPHLAVAVSMRRYEKRGYLRTLAWWAGATIVYLFPHQTLTYTPASDLEPVREPLVRKAVFKK